MKKIKLWVEMIFIFLIPLILMLVSIEIKTSNTYDTNNNILSTNKYVDIKNIDFLNDETKNYIQYEWYDTYDDEADDYIEIIFNTNQPMYIYYDFRPLENGMTELSYNDSENGLNIYYNPENSIILYDNNNNVKAILYETLYDYYNEGYIGYQWGIEEEENWNYLFEIENDEDLNLFYLSVTNYQINTKGIKKIGIYARSNMKVLKSYNTYTLNENVFNKVLNILFGALGIQENLIIQLIIIYLCLWFIMFVIWHCIYIPFDWLIHLVSPKDKGE